MLQLMLWVTGSMVAWGMNAPWVHLQTLLKNSIGANPCVQVGDYQESTGTIEITGCNPKVAEALALVLKATYPYGKPINLLVVDSDGHAAASATDPGTDAVSFVQSNLQTALEGNHYFADVEPSQGFVSLSLEFHKKVIQFWDDNLSDRYGNVNYTAQDVFMQILNATYFNNVKIGFTTAKD